MSFDRTQRLRLSPHADLKTRADGDVLVLPERALRIGGSGAEILRACERPATAKAIGAALCARYPDTPGVEEQVMAFLHEMFELGGVVLDDPDAETPAPQDSTRDSISGARS